MWLRTEVVPGAHIVLNRAFLPAIKKGRAQIPMRVIFHNIAGPGTCWLTRYNAVWTKHRAGNLHVGTRWCTCLSIFSSLCASLLLFTFYLTLFHFFKRYFFPLYPPNSVYTSNLLIYFLFLSFFLSLSLSLFLSLSYTHTHTHTHTLFIQYVYLYFYTFILTPFFVSVFHFSLSFSVCHSLQLQ